MKLADASRELHRRMAQKSNRAYIQPGTLGNETGIVDVDSVGNVNVTLADQIIQCYADPAIPRNPGLPVMVGFSLEQPNLLQVLAVRSGGLGLSRNGESLASHHEQHEWPQFDTVWIHDRQFLPLRLEIVSAWEVSLYPGWLWIDSALKYIEVTTPFNLQGKVPTTLNKARMVWFYINSTGAVVELDGAEVDQLTLDETVLPAFPAETQFILGAVRLYYHQTSITEAISGTDVLDLRFPGFHRHAATDLVGGIVVTSGTGVIVATHPVTEAGLAAALAAAPTYGSVNIPSASIGGDHTVPAHVTVLGTGRFSTSLSGKITLAGESSVLFTLSVFRVANDASSLVAVQGPASGTAYILNCGILASQSGSGNAYGIQGSTGNISVLNSRVEGIRAGAGSAYGYYSASTGLYEHNGGSLAGTTAPIYSPGAVASVIGLAMSPTVGGTPLLGDRSAWDLASESLHASDIAGSAPTRHTALPGASGNILVSDGAKWISTARGISGTSGRLAKFGASSSLGDSKIEDLIAGAFKVSLAGTLTADRTITVPDASGTIGLLELAQTWTAAQILAGSANTIQAIIKAFSTQTADLLEFQKSDGTLWGGANPYGSLFSFGRGAITSNLVMGRTAATQSTITGTKNTIIGEQADIYLTSGINNTFSGYHAGWANTTAQYNAGFGANAMSGTYPLTGSQNTAMGSSAFLVLKDGHDNTALGHQAGSSLTSGNFNMLIGRNSFASLVTGSWNTGIGAYTGNNSTGNANIFIGYQAGYYETGSSTFIVDSGSSGTEAGDRTTALLYGLMNAAPASQTLNVNGLLTALMTDAVTNTAPVIQAIAHNTSGTPAAGFGSILRFKLQSSTTADQTAADITTSWTDATDATRTSQIMITPTISATAKNRIKVADTVDIGDLAGGNYARFENDGTLVLAGTATGWKDVFFPMGSPKATGAGNPTLGNILGNLRGYSFSINDVNDFDPQEYPHDGKTGAAITWHIHWISMTNVAADRGVKWQLEYSTALPGAVMAAVATISVDLTIPANTPANTHYLSNIGTTTIAGLGAGSMTWARLTRIASATTAPAADPFVAAVHFHYEVDTPAGSRETTTK